MPENEILRVWELVCAKCKNLIARQFPDGHTIVYSPPKCNKCGNQVILEPKDELHA